MPSKCGRVGPTQKEARIVPTKFSFLFVWIGVNLVYSLHQNAFLFTSDYTKFFVNLDIFTMVKLINPPMNMD
jgi:hypothetical protein